MASRRVSLGGLVAIAAIMAAVVTGCGGGSSSAPATAGDTSESTGPTAVAPSETANGDSGSSQTKKGSTAKGQKAPSGQEGKPPANGKQKHPPIELPKGPPEKGPTRAQQEQVPTASIVLKLPKGLAKANTCEGKNASPELEWGAAPANTAELVVLAASVAPVNGKLHFDWAMAHLDPSLEGLKEGEVPKGAVLGRNGDGQNKYSICPPAGKAETYLFSVYAVTKSVSPKQGFDPLSLRKEASPLSESVGLEAATYGGE